jgi:hypothetical protein
MDLIQTTNKAKNLSQIRPPVDWPANRANKIVFPMEKITYAITK